MDRELELTQASLEELGILGDVQQVTSRHFSVPAGAEDTLQAMLLGPGTPAHSPTDLSVGLDWGKNRLGQTLCRIPPEAWLRLLRRSMRRKLRTLLTKYPPPHASAAMKSRYRLTFILDITTLLKVGKMLGVAGMFSSGMLQRPAHSIEGVVLYAVVGKGGLCLPLDLRRSLACRFLGLEGHFLVADAWFEDHPLLRRAQQMHLIPIVQGKTSFVFEGTLHGTPFEGSAQELLQRPEWKWKVSPQGPDIPSGRLTLTNPPFGKVVVVLRKLPGEEKPDYLMGPKVTVTAPRRLRAYRRRPWIDTFFEVCKATLGIEPFKVRSLGGIYGGVALRFLSFVVVDSAGRRLSHGHLTGGQIVRTLRYHGTLWLKQLLESKVLSQHPTPQTKAA